MSESRRFVLGVSYEGSAWQGWQTQPHGLTVQDTLESALSRFSNQPIHTICAGRTDTGVHAFEQVVHFDTTAHRDDESWVRGVNALLPPSIAVRWAQETSEHFHARFSAQKRTYVYVLFEGRVMSPFWKGKAGWSFRPLDLEAMQNAAQFLIGEHDFSSFRAASCQAHSPVRVLDVLEVSRQRQFFVFTLRANAFLHHMVRNIVGALVLIGQGKQKASWMQEVLQAKDRRYAAPTFSPDGLYLVKVDYPDEFLFPIRSFSDELGF